MTEDAATYVAEDGTVRQGYYGDGIQPWDRMVRLGIAAPFAVGSILKYLGRTKEPEHSLESARWYWARLIEFAKDEPPRQTSTPFYHHLNHFQAKTGIEQLRSELTAQEFLKIEPAAGV